MYSKLNENQMRPNLFKIQRSASGADEGSQSIRNKPLKYPGSTVRENIMFV